MSYANNKGADQPAHPHSLISTFAVCCLDSIIPLVSIISLQLDSVAAQAGLSLTWSKTPKAGFLVAWLIFYLQRTGSSVFIKNPHYVYIDQSELSLEFVSAEWYL